MDTGESKPFHIIENNHFHRYLQYAETIIASYKGTGTLQLFLRKYFSVNKKHGSGDRKIITALCYNYYRLGFGVSGGKSVIEKLSLSSFLCAQNDPLLLKFFHNENQIPVKLPLEEKIAIENDHFDPKKIFPFPEELSNEIDFKEFSLSFLVQPKLFIRVREGFKQQAIQKIKNAGFDYDEAGTRCFAFTNNEKVSSIIDIDKEAVVQDYNSQKTLNILLKESINLPPVINAWDCCAGSGGKSILAYDLLKNIHLTVSDKRKDILENLTIRFKVAGITSYTLALADLQFPVASPMIGDQQFDVIITDVPCSGSGTWSRTPEQLSFFPKKEIASYASLQKKIIKNSMPYLKVEGFFLYITCSVFSKENEANVAYIREEFQLRLLEMQYLRGYQIQADTLFVALFKK